MKLSIISFSLVLLCSCGTTRIGANLGPSKLVDSELGGAGSQFSLGVEVTSTPEEGGLGLETGLRTAVGSGDDTFTDIFTADLYGGGRYEWHFDSLRPFVSAGIGLQNFNGEMKAGDSAAAVSPGIYLGAGVDYDITENVFIGLGLRQTFLHQATVEGGQGSTNRYDTDYDTNAFQILLRIGFAL